MKPSKLYARQQDRRRWHAEKKAIGVENIIVRGDNVPAGTPDEIVAFLDSATPSAWLRGAILGALECDPRLVWLESQELTFFLRRRLGARAAPTVWRPNRSK